jgi:hypothetical protein
MPKLFLLLLSCLPLILLSQTGKTSRTTVIDSAFTLQLPAALEETPQLLESIKPLNDKVIYMGVLASAGKRVPFSISRYPNVQNIPRKEAFSGTLRAAAHGPTVVGSHRIVSGEVYQKQGRELCRKITQLTFDGGKVVRNIMFYFMRKDGEALYELKIACEPVNQDVCEHELEEMALTLSFR